MKTTPKRHAQLTHKIAVLSCLMIDALDDIGANSSIALSFKNKCEDMIPFCERILTDSFSAKQVRNTTYLNDLANKVDTVIRKNYQKITE